MTRFYQWYLNSLSPEVLFRSISICANYKRIIVASATTGMGFYWFINSSDDNAVCRSNLRHWALGRSDGAPFLLVVGAERFCSQPCLFSSRCWCCLSPHAWVRGQRLRSC